MQTFLPYADFARSAEVLDRQRLGKQRVEAWQIVKALRGETKGWVNHPATVMWRGYETALMSYATAICQEWISRGYKDTMLERFEFESSSLVIPPWLGDEDFHLAHQSNLVRKDRLHYGEIFFGVPDDLPYIWPAGIACAS